MHLPFFYFAFLTILVAFSTTLNAKQLTENEIAKVNNLSMKYERLSNQIALLDIKYEALKFELKQLDSSPQATHADKMVSSESIGELSQKLSNLEYEIKRLDSQMNQISTNDGYNDWIGKMLGAASLIITALSFTIAILAFWGYRNIKVGAVESAIEQSKTAVSSKLENGDFDNIIFKAVEKTIYRDVLSEDDFPIESSEGKR